MYLYFIDESGDCGDPNTSNCGKIFVLGGVIIRDDDWQYIESDLKQLKTSYGVNPSEEVKWRHTRQQKRHTSPDNPIKHLEEKARRQFAKDVLRIVKTSKNTRVIATVIRKDKAFKKSHVNSPNDLYCEALKFVVERFHHFLRPKPQQFGMVLLDHREEREDQRVRTFFQSMLDHGTRWTQFPKIVECAFFGPSDFSVGIQLADFVAGAVFVEFTRANHNYTSIIRGKITGRRQEGKRDGLKIKQ